MQSVIVKVSAGARTEKVEEVAPGQLKVRVQAPPEKGRANKRVMELVANHYGVSVSSVILESGATSRDKRFTILS